MTFSTVLKTSKHLNRKQKTNYLQIKDGDAYFVENKGFSSQRKEGNKKEKGRRGRREDEPGTVDG